MTNNNLYLNDYQDRPDLLSKLKTREGYDILFLHQKHDSDIQLGKPSWMYVYGHKGHPIGSNWCYTNGMCFSITPSSNDIVLKDTSTTMATKSQPTTKSLYYPVCTDSYGEPQIWKGQDSLEQAKKILSEAIKDRKFDLTDKDDAYQIRSNYFILKADELYHAKVSIPELKDCLTFEKE